MKLNGYQVEEHGEGYALTLRFWVPRESDLGEHIRDLGDLFAGATQPITDSVSPPSYGKEENDGHDEPVQDAAPAGRRSRRQRQRDDSAEDELPADDAGAKEAGSDDEGTGTTGRRRRRRSGSASGSGGVDSGEVSGGEVAEDPTKDAPSAGRRRSRKKAADTAAEPATTTKSPSDISDVDLTKAASEAARVISTQGVMGILEEFGVGKVNELAGDQRQEFLDRLAAEKKEAEWCF